jgi:hypothetical protein
MLTLNNNNIVIDLTCKAHNLGMATLTQQNNTTTKRFHTLVCLTHTTLEAGNNGTRSVDNTYTKALSQLIGAWGLAMCAYEQHATTDTLYLIMRDGAQAESLKALHLDTVVHNVAQRRHLANTLQGSLRLANGTHNAKAEARIFIYRNTHN